MKHFAQPSYYLWGFVNLWKHLQIKSNYFAAASRSTTPSQVIAEQHIRHKSHPAGITAEWGRTYKAQRVILFPSFNLLFPVFLPSASALPSFFLFFSHLPSVFTSAFLLPSLPSLCPSFCHCFHLSFLLLFLHLSIYFAMLIHVLPSTLPSSFPSILPSLCLCLYMFFLLPFHPLLHPSILHSVLHSFLPHFAHASIPLFHQSYFYLSLFPLVCPLVSLYVPLSTHSFFFLFILLFVLPSSWLSCFFYFCPSIPKSVPPSIHSHLYIPIIYQIHIFIVAKTDPFLASSSRSPFVLHLGVSVCPAVLPSFCPLSWWRHLGAAKGPFPTAAGWTPSPPCRAHME